MKYLKLVLPVMLLVLSATVSATTVTHGNLTSDDTTNFIKDTVTGREYLRFDTLNLSYADTLTAVGAGGTYDGWSIATAGIADDFYSAIHGIPAIDCNGLCGRIGGWAEGDFGSRDNNSDKTLLNNSDGFWYLSDVAQYAGYGHIYSAGIVRDYFKLYRLDKTDDFTTVDYLVYRDVSPVPVPAAAWLFGSGLIGLIGVARRKKS